MPCTRLRSNLLNSRATRRSVLASGIVGTTLARFPSLVSLAETAPVWHVWLIGSSNELRPAEPPRPSQEEIDELLELRDRQSSQTIALIERWNTGPAVVPWTNQILKLIMTHRPSPVRAGRALALLHTAMSDAVAAAADARVTYQRPGPYEFDLGIEPVVEARGSSFPSGHAAIAGAAEVVLPYLFPDEPAEVITLMAEQAVMSRLWAGANFRSDIEVGQELGRAVGALAVARGKADGSDAESDGSNRLTGEGYWEPTPPMFVDQPLDPLAGAWKTWVLESGEALRPSPPPEYGSPAWEAELLAVQEAVANRTKEQEEAVNFWAGSPGTVTPAGLWNEIARDLIIRDKLGTWSAAHALAMMNVAIADGFICCWDAKFTYWTARPITSDPTLNVQIPTPPFPSYTSGHSTISAAAATVLAHLFPDDAERLLDQANEAKDSRLWAGIHFPIDNDMGATGGAQVGRLVVAAVAR